MSEAFHANTSTFARRKVTSASSYLSSRVELMVKAPPMPSSLTETFLVPGGVALDLLLPPAELSGTSSATALHSEEVRLPEWVSEVSLAFFFFFPPGVPAAGASAPAVAAAATACWYSWSAQVSASFLSEGMVMIVMGLGIFRVLYA